ncbi:MAG: pyridoxamine 5'-phosphate oxidase family protein [Lachnospiraceae bacterium]|nr:pyridoxamine 5'-phosphate oxidase family protein [Lachnospiraceae bacterium]
MDRNEALRIIAEELKTCVIATVDEDNRPVTAVIDIMDHDENGLYFLTGRGKGLYNRLQHSPYVAVTLTRGSLDTEYLAVSVRGHAVEAGPARLKRLFQKNPFMYKMYPDPAKWEAAGLTVFCIDSGSVEWLTMKGPDMKREIINFGSTPG